MRKESRNMARNLPSTFWGWLKPTSPLMQTLFAAVGLAGALLLVRVSQVLYTKATYMPANIQVDFSKKLGPLKRPWANYAQGGEDHNWRLKPVASQLKLLRPEYIRLDHVFDFYDIVSGTPGNLSFDFTKLDPLLTDIQEVGATPYIALSYMPPQLTRDDSIVGQPLRYEDWQEMVRQLVQHVSGTRGFNNVYYEVWNEPDLFGNWYYGGQKNYLELYGAAARGAAAASITTSYKIGGPAITAPYKNWFTSLAEYAQSTQTRLDFVSWHRYSSDLNQFRKDAADVRSWLAPYPGLLQKAELHITEWGHDSEMHDGYDTAYSAAHTAAVALDLIGTVDRAFVFEIQDGLDPAGKKLWGRWGMFAHTSAGAKAKPRFNALLLLNRLGTQLVELTGKGTYVKAAATTREDGSAQIVLANFDPKGTNVETVPVTITGLAPGEYGITMTFLTRSPSKTSMTLTKLSQVQLKVPLGAHEVAVVEIQPL